MRRHRRENASVRPTGERPASAVAEHPVVLGLGGMLAEPGRQLAGQQRAGQQRAGGYRLVRSLGEGRSAVVHLGYADTVADDEPRRTAAVKVYRPGVTPERVDAEVSALAAAAHPHLLRLVDIATAPGAHPCLVLERCAAGTLAALVANRASLAAGEAVTILAPLVAAVEALHAAGFVHRDIRLSRVLFRASGAPVLAGLGHAAGIPALLSPAALAAHPAVLDDRAQLARLVDAVLERVDDPGARAVESWLGQTPTATDDFCARLSDALFDLAEAQPVRLRDDGEPAVRLGQPRRPATVVVDNAETSSTVKARILAVARAMPAHARGVRRPVWIAAGGVAVSLLVAALAIPTGDTAAEPDERERAPSTGPSAETDRTGGTGDTGGDPLPDDPLPDDPLPGDVVLGDDPVAAIVVLLDERDRCLREISVLCLEAVAQPGSAAMERDVAVVRALQAGGEQSADDTITTEGAVVVERLGDSVLLDLGDVPETQPASALVMRGEAGWRIRDYLDD